jgi:type II secretory pathway pseudopilin PulG
MHRLSRGFTLIEQVAVIAAVATASVTAMPSLLAVRDDAQAAMLASLAGALSSAMLLNQGGCLVTEQQAVADKCTPIQDCGDVAALLNGGLPRGYSVVPGNLLGGRGAACRLRQDSSGTEAVFTGIASGH